MTFPFERLSVYKRAEEWADFAEKLAARARPHKTYGMVDQLARAASSIPLNVTEGLGIWGSADRKRFFLIARGSVFECVPIINFFKRKSIINAADHRRAYAILDELGKMLTAMILAKGEKD